MAQITTMALDVITEPLDMSGSKRIKNYGIEPCLTLAKGVHPAAQDGCEFGPTQNRKFT